jgi:hypothetical protein
MRWQQLFADLSAQFDAAEAAGHGAELASRTRAGYAGCSARLCCSIAGMSVASRAC